MPYELRASPPTVDRFLELRDAAGMSERSREAVERGLPNSQYVITVVATGEDAEKDQIGHETTAHTDGSGSGEHVVGMARIVGDGGSVYYICDMVIHPDHQRQGLGSRLMDALMEWIHETASSERAAF